MDRAAPAPTPRVLILKADRLYADILRHYTDQVLNPVEIAIARTVATARDHVATRPLDLLITGLGDPLEGDAIDLVAQCLRPPRRVRRIMVVTMRREYRVFAALRTLPVEGVFDTAEEPSSAFPGALRTIMDGTRYWSSSVIRHVQEVASGPKALVRILSDFELVVLSVLGGGCDNSEAARLLGLSPATISTVRRGLHRKLGVQHRGDLVRMAAQNGFVRFTPEGVERPGFSLLTSAYHPRERRKKGPKNPRTERN